MAEPGDYIVALESLASENSAISFIAKRSFVVVGLINEETHRVYHQLAVLLRPSTFVIRAFAYECL